MEHLNRQIPPKAHTAMYNWHKFWGRKTWNVVSEFIQTYSPKGGIVMDPFSGSGVTALEALKQGRRVIAVDINPIANEILRLTVQHIDPLLLTNAFGRIKKAVKADIMALYSAECRRCNEQIPIECAVWKRDEKKNLTLKENRYKCQHCGEVVEKGGKPSRNDLDSIKSVFERFAKTKLWYPRNPLYYSDGLPFKEKQQYDSLVELFTPRNLLALAMLMHSIEKEEDKKAKDFLKIAFSSMVHLCSTMGAISDPLPTSHHTSFSSTGWTQHSYWYAREFMEQNVWNKFESSILGNQGLLKAKVESNRHFKGMKITHNLNTFLNDSSDICILTDSCVDVFEKMPARSVDYIFTDPPYDASIQYGELSYLWAAWLKKDTEYVDTISSEEIVRNERQHKNFDIYHTLLRRSFEGMYKVMKLNRYLTLTFHNPTFKVRNATIRAGTHVGFDFEKIHHQPTAQKSGKSLLQPFGSAMGDFYLRFHKPISTTQKAELPEEIDERRFERIVVDTTIELLAERAEPTSYTMIINFIDPVLAKRGYFSSLQTGLDVKKVLKDHLNIEFRLVTEKIGGAKGQLWWFKDPKMVYRLKEIPLSERVEQTVLRILQKKGKLSFTDAWEAVSIEFPNSLTSDSTSIKEALEQYARQVTGGLWLFKPQINQRLTQHNELIAILAEVGKANGNSVWIGKKEQSESAFGVHGSVKALREYVDTDLQDVVGVQNRETVEMIDVLWIKRKHIVCAFEIESTTTMTSGLVRGSNLSVEIPKYLVIPEEREDQLQRKMKSPMFSERFQFDNWSVLYFDLIRNNYKRLKSTDLVIQDLVNQKLHPGVIKEQEMTYNLFS